MTTRLGLTSFGGPIAHLGYYHQEYVVRRRWIDEAAFADVVAMCQALPGPASTQTTISVGVIRAGLLGGLMAWIGFTLPSAVLMVAFALGLDAIGNVDTAGWLHGLKVAAVAVVAFAVWTMGRSLTPDLPRAALALLAAAVMLLAWQSAFLQIGVIGVGAVVGWLLFRNTPLVGVRALRVPVRRNVAVAAWVLFFALLVALPLLRGVVTSQALDLFDSFYRAGSLVFGGGHVVLPLLQREVVDPGWVSQSDFVAGYGAAQAVPGPVFTFAAYLGAVMGPDPSGVIGATIALVAIFLPSVFLVTGGLPVWSRLRQVAAFQSALRGVNAAVVGLLLAALYDPVWKSAIFDVWDFLLAAVALVLLWRRVPPWAVVLVAAAGGELLAAV